MKPYYEEAGIQIFHGDCREILPRMPQCDLLCTDPPYGIGEAKKNHQSRGGRPYKGSNGKPIPGNDYGPPLEWDNATPPRWLLEQAIDKARHAILFGGNYYGLEPSSCWLVWDKDNGANDFADCELAWTNLKKAVRRLRFRWQGMLQEHMGADKEPHFHPTQKPLAVMTWAIQQAPDDCAVILDPWMGSGTTLRAAKDLGRKAIGIEIEERYCEIAVNRLRQGVLFGAPA